jgi:hypothetical protein
MQAVLQVVHRVRHVVGPVHDLSLQAGAPLRRSVTDPAEHLTVVGVVTELLGTLRSLLPGQARRRELRGRSPGLAGHPTRAGGPGVFDRRVQRGARKVQARPGDLGLQPGQQPQALRVPLEPATAGGELRENDLPVVAKRRVPQIVCQAGGVDQVRIAAEGRAELTPDLRALQRVGEPGAREVVRAHFDDLRLGGQAPQGRRVQHPGPVTYERPPLVARRGLCPLRRLGHPAVGRVGVVARMPAHLLSLPPAVSSTTARPASSLATGTRNGEQDT